LLVRREGRITMKSRAFLDWFYLGIASSIAALTVAAHWDTEFIFDLRLNQSLFRWSLLATGLGATAAEVFATTRGSYAAGLAVHFVSTVLLLPLVASQPSTAIAVMAVPLLSIATVSPPPCYWGL
jgi:hypothetical protein